MSLRLTHCHCQGPRRATPAYGHLLTAVTKATLTSVGTAHTDKPSCMHLHHCTDAVGGQREGGGGYIETHLYNLLSLCLLTSGTCLQSLQLITGNLWVGNFWLPMLGN